MQNRVSKITEWNGVTWRSQFKCNDCQKWFPESSVIFDTAMFHDVFTKFALCKTCNDAFL